MDRNLCLQPMPGPKYGRSRPATTAAAPAAFRLVHLQVIGREQMTIAADIGYGHGLEDTFQGKARHIGFGCCKARPPTTFQSITYKKNFGAFARAARAIPGTPVPISQQVGLIRLQPLSSGLHTGTQPGTYTH